MVVSSFSGILLPVNTLEDFKLKDNILTGCLQYVP